VVWAAAPDWTGPATAPCRSRCCLRAACSASARCGRWPAPAWQFETVFTCDSLLGLAAAAQAGFALTVLGRHGFPPGLREWTASPRSARWRWRSSATRPARTQLVEPLVGFIRESLSPASG
jgi:hypothetical protein